MAELWVAAAVTVVGGAVAGYGAQKKAEAERKANREDNKEMTEREAKLSAQASGYERALEDYYTQKSRFDQQRGLDQYRKFSTMGQFAPGIDDTGGRVVMPEAPDYNNYAVKDVQEEAAQGGGKGGKSFIKKAMGDHDPIGKALGLFG